MAGVVTFGETPRGETVHRLEIGSGALRAGVLSYGAALQEVRLAGVPHGLTLGFPTLAPYLGAYRHAGTLMGPVANRISDARATIDSDVFHFDTNFQERHTIHGGAAGIQAKTWEIADHGPDHVALRLALPPGEGGFPGARQILARYESQDALLQLTVEAQTDAPTLMNLANHSYWNLGPEPTTAGHHLQVMAEHYLPGDPHTTIPTGEIAPVAGTRFDYRAPRRIEAGAEGLLDLNFCLSETREALRPVAVLTGPTGVRMEMATTEPGLQVFDGHILGAERILTHDGRTTQAYGALALEAQFWPDAPTKPHFPDITLRPGAPWRQITTWRFLL